MLRRLVFGMISGALVLLTASSALAAGGTTWKLVNATCSGSQVEVGQGCYDQGNGSGSSWQVHAGSATWTDPTFHVEFTYTVPGTVGPDGGAVALAVTATDVSNNSGILGQLCATTSFGTKDSDPCARAHATTPGSSASGSKTLHLSTAIGSAGATQTVTINVGSGHVTFTYKAQAGSASGSGSSGNQVVYSVSSQIAVPHSKVSIHLTASGTFNLTHLPDSSATAAGFNSRGTAALRLTAAKGAYTLGLAIKSVAFEKAGATRTVLITYRVTSSGVSCPKVGSTFTVTAISDGANDRIELAGLCGLRTEHFTDGKTTVTVRLK